MYIQDEFPEVESVKSKGYKFHILLDKTTCPYGSYSGCSQRCVPAWFLYNTVVYSQMVKERLAQWG